MMPTNAIVSLTILGALLFGAMAFGNEPTRSGHTYRIGWLSVKDGGRTDYLKDFRSEMAILGWNDRNAEYVERWAQGRRERLPGLAAELVASRVDVIVALDDASVQAATKATRQVPIVFLAWDPEGAGIVTSLARPGGNATGLSIMATDLFAKELTLLKEAIPGLRKVAILTDSADPTYDAISRALRSTSQALGIEPVVVDVQPLDGLDVRLNDVIARGVQAMTGKTSSGPSEGIILRMALANRIPLADYALAPPGLVSLEVDWQHMIKRSAHYADRILRGANPGELAVEQPTKFWFGINVTTAKLFGLTIPRSLLLRADELIE